jgi:hypothetical protein
MNITNPENFYPNRWLAVFDILGFSKFVETKPPIIVREGYEEVLRLFEEATKDQKGISKAWFSDTFIMYSGDDSIAPYPNLWQAAHVFFKECINVRMPMRGAIHFGPFHVEKERDTFIGPAFIEAFQSAEMQDWVGLIMTEDAIHRIRKNELEPLHHSFAKTEIPFHKGKSEGRCDKLFYAYTFAHGATNYEEPEIKILEELRHYAPEKDKIKYSRTIDHIRMFHRKMAVPNGRYLGSQE